MATVLVLVAAKRQGRRTAEWFAHGAELAGYKAKRLAEANYTEPCSDILVHYGFDGSPDSAIARAHADYVRAGLKAVYADIGYFRMRGRPFDRYEDYQAVIDKRAPSHGIFPKRETRRRPGRRPQHCYCARDAAREKHRPLWHEPKGLGVR